MVACQLQAYVFAIRHPLAAKASAINADYQGFFMCSSRSSLGSRT